MLRYPTYSMCNRLHRLRIRPGTQLLDGEFAVENPFLWKTESDVVGIIKKAGLADLIQISNSYTTLWSAEVDGW
jgi:hypothetical protein